MSDVIDLTDTPVPEKSRPPQSQSIQHQLPSRPPSHLGHFSSDSIDVSLFAYNDDDFLDKPAKKRRVSNNNPSPLRQNTTARESTPPDPDPRFLFSDEDFGLPPSNPAAPKRPSQQDVEESDPIVFTSSAPEPMSKRSAPRKPNHQNSGIITLDDDDDFISAGPQKPCHHSLDDIDEFSDPFSLPDSNGLMGLSQAETAASNSVFSNKTAALLAHLGENEKGTKGKLVSKTHSRSQRGKGTRVGAAALLELSDEIEEPVELRRPAKKSSKLTTEEKEAKAGAREAAKAQRERDRQLEKERKKKLKEEKAREKQLAVDIAEVNKLKVDKKESTPEMIIDMASSLENTSVGNQVVEFMRHLGVENTFFTSSTPNVVKWRRKMRAKYNEAAGHWEPCPFYIQQEAHVLCLLPAQEFVDMVISDSDNADSDTLDLHVCRVKSAYPGCKPIYLIEGLTAWMRKNSNSRNRAFQAEVLRQYEQPGTDASEGYSTARKRKKTKNKPETTPPVDDDTIEDALLALQVTHACLIHHTNAPAESAEWIKNFTEHVSTIPYRRERMEGYDAAFCMDGGQIKPGEDNLDTFVKMLQEVNRVTAAMAYGIAAQYPCVTDLVRAMRMHGPTLLEDVKKSANKNGALTDSRIGPAASKRLYKVFTGLDPTSTDV